MSGPAIRMASPEDSAQLAALHAQCFDEAWDEASFAAFVRDSFTFALVAEDARAFIVVRVAADESEILTLGTHPDSRRRGLARALIEKWPSTDRRSPATLELRLCTLPPAHRTDAFTQVEILDTMRAGHGTTSANSVLAPEIRPCYRIDLTQITGHSKDQPDINPMCTSASH